VYWQPWLQKFVGYNTDRTEKWEYVDVMRDGNGNPAWQKFQTINSDYQYALDQFMQSAYPTYGFNSYLGTPIMRNQSYRIVHYVFWSANGEYGTKISAFCTN
jgi:hypothetical protein